MEEVWKDITLSSVHFPLNLNAHPTTTSRTSHGMILQDLLTPSSARRDPLNSGIRVQPAPAPATSLTLNRSCASSSSTGGDQSLATSQLLYATTPCFLSAFNSLFEGLASSSSSSSSSTTCLLDPFLKKRSSEEGDCSGDRRCKRMMKNRDSAARSRARRMAYTFELESERSQLMEENARLRSVLQIQQVKMQREINIRKS